MLKTFSATFIALLLLTVYACDKDDEPGVVNIYLTQSVGDQAVEFDTIKYTSKAGHIYSVARVKYYISNVELHEEDGTTYALEDVHYRDAADETTRTLSFADVPVGTYNKISFTYGLDEQTNVDDGLPNSTTNINMEWPIPGDQGYHYMKFEGKYDSLGSGVIKNFNLHTGATMGNQNFVDMELPLTTFSIDDNSWGISLNMDVNEWLQNPTDWDFETYGPMIMMNQAAQEVLKANASTVFSIESVVKE